MVSYRGRSAVSGLGDRQVFQVTAQKFPLLIKTTFSQDMIDKQRSPQSNDLGLSYYLQTLHALRFFTGHVVFLRSLGQQVLNLLPVFFLKDRTGGSCPARHHTYCPATKESTFSLRRASPLRDFCRINKQCSKSRPVAGGLPKGAFTGRKMKRKQS